MTPFVGMPKIARISRTVVVTEKIDGTNAQIWIPDQVELDEMDPVERPAPGFFCGSKSRWITPAQDNYGFARWAWLNADTLMELGVGHHFGEWWGKGIQRNYGLAERKFSLFNVARWADGSSRGPRPACCDVVPIIWTGLYDEFNASEHLYGLACSGSHAAPGWMQPEGIVIFHTAANVAFKKTIFDDAAPKSLVNP